MNLEHSKFEQIVKDFVSLLAAKHPHVKVVTARSGRWVARLSSVGKSRLALFRTGGVRSSLSMVLSTRFAVRRP